MQSDPNGTIGEAIPVDPLLDLIARFREAEAASDADRTNSPELQGAFCDLYAQLRAAPAPTTREGAVEALRLLKHELALAVDDRAIATLTDGVVAFLGGAPAEGWRSPVAAVRMPEAPIIRAAIDADALAALSMGELAALHSGVGTLAGIIASMCSQPRFAGPTRGERNAAGRILDTLDNLASRLQDAALAEVRRRSPATPEEAEARAWMLLEEAAVCRDRRALAVALGSGLAAGLEAA